MDEGMDSGRGPPHVGGSHWFSTDISYQPGSSSGNSSQVIRMDESGESSSGGQGVYRQDCGKGPESSRPPIHKPAQVSSKLVATRSSGARRTQRAQQGSLQGPWNVLQSYPGHLNDPALESTGMDAEANLAMGLNTQLMSNEAALRSGQEQADNEYNLFWSRGGRSTPNCLAGRGPVPGSSATEYFPSRRGHVTEQVGAWNGMSGVPQLGSRQAQADADVAYPRGSIGSIGIEDRQVDGVGGSMSFNSLNSFYRDHQGFLNGGRNGFNDKRADDSSGSGAFNSLYVDHPNYTAEANLQASSSNYANSAQMEAFWAAAGRHHATLETHAACRSNGFHIATERHPSKSNPREKTSENGASSSVNVSSTSRSSACKRKSCTPVVAGSSSSQSDSLHRGRFRESYGRGAVGGSSMSRCNGGIASCTSAADVGASTSSSAEATCRGLCFVPLVGTGTEDPQTQSSHCGSETELLPEACRDSRAGKNAVGSSSTTRSSRGFTRGGPVGVVLMEAGAVQPPPPFARTVRRAVPGLSPETWGSCRTPLTNSSMDADDSIPTTNLLVDQMLSSSAPQCNGTPSVVGGRGGPPASLQHSESMLGSTGLGEQPTLRYAGNSTRNLATRAASASQLRAAVAAERRLCNHAINYHSLQSMSLPAPLPSNTVIPMVQTTANSAAPSSPCPLRPPPHPPIPRSRLQGSTTHMSMLSPSSSGPPSRLAHAPPFNPSVLAPSIDSLPSAASLLQRSMLPRLSAPGVRDRGLSSVAESLLGMPFRGLHMSPGDGAPQPRLAADGLAEILLALERVERDEDLTYEQLLMLEATLLFGGMGLHDQHSDLRLDVDNMSYEELLALEERIGNVSTGLTAEVADQKLKRSQYSSLDAMVAHFSEECDIKCSICQEEYVEGDELGKIDCGHGYHVSCIRQWLVQKNQCPICKATALS